MNFLKKRKLGETNGAASGLGKRQKKLSSLFFVLIWSKVFDVQDT